MSIRFGFPVIGDVVSSRQQADRRRAQHDLTVALDDLNRSEAFLQPFDPTVGDEFQGVCATLGDAIVATLLVRLLLPVGLDVRCGIGFGEVMVLDDSRQPFLQDGPGWWAARRAVGEASTRAKRPRSDYLRTWFADRPERRTAAAGQSSKDPSGADPSGAEPSAAGPDEPADGPEDAKLSAGAVNALLMCRDQMVDRLNPASRDLLRLSLQDLTQEEMASAQGISQSAVSQRLARSGINAIKDAHDLVKGGWR